MEKLADTNKMIMKKWPLLLLLLLPLTNNYANDGNWSAPDRPKGPQQDTAQFPYFPSRLNTSFDNESTVIRYESATACGICHDEIYQQWQQSAMAHAWEDPVYRALLDRASIATQGAIDNFCIGCHSPIGLITTALSVKNQDINVPGVDCETCHNVSARSGRDNGALVISHSLHNGKTTKYGPRKDAVSPSHHTQYSALHTRSDFCAVCHNVTHPFNGAAIERTYDEWLDSPYSEAGIECQDCHMTPGPGVTSNPGKAAIMGKERDHISSHFFAGANVPLMRYFGNDKMAERNIKMLKSAAKIELIAPQQPVIAGNMVNVRYKVMNVGAGHKLPTGFPEGREMWVDFRVLDQQGRVIFRSGNIENGKTAPGTISFKVTMADKHGQIVDINVWEVDHIISDTRIMPKGYSIIDYHFFLPADSPDKLTLEADLNYWPFSQYMIDDLLKDKAFPVEIVTMASIKSALYVRRL